MKVGVLLPLFRATPDDALHSAREAESAGLHGAFAYDHLWPIGKRDLPALAPFPILARVLAETTSLMVGPLVARVGLVPDEVLLGQILTLHATGRGRVLAPLGLGDGLSDAENEAYGLERAPLEERRDRLGHLLDALAREGIPTWVGGTGPKTVALARSHGAAVNAWASSLDVVASLASEGEVTWAGDLPADLDDADRFLDGLHEAGASWVVATYGTEISTLADLVTPKPWFAAR